MDLEDLERKIKSERQEPLPFEHENEVSKAKIEALEKFKFGLWTWNERLKESNESIDAKNRELVFERPKFAAVRASCVFTLS